MSDHNSFSGGPSRMLRHLRELSREQDERSQVLAREREVAAAKDAVEAKVVSDGN